MANKAGRRTVQPVPPSVTRPVVPVVTGTISATRVSSGPIPEPEIFRAYGEVLANAPDRILRMAEQEAEQRQAREMWKVRGDVILAHLGVVCGFAIGVTTVLAGASVVMAGHDLAGFGLGSAGLAGLVGVFIYGTRANAAGKASQQEQVQTVVKADK